MQLPKLVSAGPPDAFEGGLQFLRCLIRCRNSLRYEVNSLRQPRRVSLWRQTVAQFIPHLIPLIPQAPNEEELQRAEPKRYKCVPSRDVSLRSFGV